jgi:phytoene dehydrogenase-like protein
VAIPDAIVVGAGPNGLAAAIVLAQRGLRVVVYEAEPAIGGGCRSEHLTLPGFLHDVCSSVYPMAVASPFFQSLPLGEHGLDWIHPPATLAHPFDGHVLAAIVVRSITDTAGALGADGRAYRRSIGSVVRDWARLTDVVLGSMALRIPSHPLAAARFGVAALQSAERLSARRFRTERARSLLAGNAAHGMLPLDMAPSGAVGLVLAAVAHTHGWPIPRGGAQRLADALAGCLRSLGGEIVTSSRIDSIEDLPAARAILCDLSPRPFLRIAGRLLPDAYRRQLAHYQYGMGSYKVDFALDAPVPWADPAVASAATVHLGGSLADIATAERLAWEGRIPERPFVIVSQPSLFDGTRAPAGRHTLWAYCHVPHGSSADMLPRIERQIERFAPGFRDRILARHVTTPDDFERRNPNLSGGDIGMGIADLRQMFARPTWRRYRTPRRGLYLCSAATPPGVGVHGMCGYHAAQAALNDDLW